MKLVTDTERDDCRAPTIRSQNMKDMSVNRRSFAVLLGLGLMLALVGGDTFAQSTQSGASGLPVPRFVSLKSDRVNVRRGPGRDHEIMWTYVRAGLPVEIVQEFENWRRIRDWEGGEGWVFHSLLSGRRTAIVKPWEESGEVPLRTSADSNAPTVARLEPKVVASVSECASGWCKIAGSKWSGWIDQTLLFGVYPDESFD